MVCVCAGSTDQARPVASTVGKKDPRKGIGTGTGIRTRVDTAPLKRSKRKRKGPKTPLSVSVRQSVTSSNWFAPSSRPLVHTSSRQSICLSLTILILSVCPRPQRPLDFLSSWPSVTPPTVVFPPQVPSPKSQGPKPKPKRSKTKSHDPPTTSANFTTNFGRLTCNALWEFPATYYEYHCHHCGLANVQPSYYR